jgi:hypothetical protein
MEQQRDWLYLLPSGETAENMMEARELLGKDVGHKIGHQAFRFLVKNHSVVKINRITHSVILQGDANETNGRKTA